MVEERVTDGVRIAQLFASEVSGGATPAALSVTAANPDVEPTPDGATAYHVAYDGQRVARVAVQPDRAFVEFRRVPGAVADAAGDAELRARPAATQPPRTLVFLPDGVAVKRVIPVLRAVADAVETGTTDGANAGERTESTDETDASRGSDTADGDESSEETEPTGGTCDGGESGGR